MINKNNKIQLKTQNNIKQDDLVLYGFTYAKFVENGPTKGYIEVKQGHTTQGLDDGLTIDESGMVRISQQGKSAEAYKKIIVGTYGVPKTIIKSDSVIHKELKKRGLRPKALDGQGQEWYRIPGKTIEEVDKYMKDLIISIGASSNKKLKLRKEQERTLIEAIEIYNSTNSDRVDIAVNLPPRFGKTTWALTLFNELNKKVLVLPSSWLSTHTSFEDDIKEFRDFSDIVCIDSKNDNYSKQIKKALSENKRVAVYISLFSKDKKQFNTIKNIPNSDKFVCVDEGDFGSWTDKKRVILDHLVSKKNTGKYCVVTMSGTNTARMVTGSKNLDGVVQSTYMALEQTENKIVKRVGVKLQLSNTDKYIKELTENDYFSYNKAMADPDKSKNFWSLFVKGITGNTENPAYKNLNISTMMNTLFNCGMMFVSGKNKNIEKLRQVIETAIPTWTIIVVNSDHTSNNKAKNDVREQIEWSKKENKEGVLIIANTMGSRSFSISEIQATIIAYDKGGIDPTVQKVSRCLTPGKMLNGEVKEQGYIVTCSMDSNRDQVLTNILTEEAAIQSEISKESLPKTTKQLLNNVSILTTDEYGNKIELTYDELIEEMSSNNILRKIAYQLSKPENILDDLELLTNILSMPVGKNKKNKKDTQLPETEDFLSSSKKQSSSKQKNKLDEINKRFKMLCDSSSLVSAKSKGNTYRECLDNIDSNYFTKIFNIDPKEIIKILDKKALNEMLLDSIVVTTKNVIKSGDINKFQDLDNLGEVPELGLVKSKEKELWTKKLEKHKNIKTKNIVVFGSIMGWEVTALLEMNVPKKNITMIHEDGFSTLWKKAGIRYINKPIQEVNNMKFDIGLGNPPFSQGNTGKGGTSIYQTFAEWGLVNCKEVAMITPGSFMTGSRFETMRKLLDEKGISNIESIPLDTFATASIVNPVYWIANGGMKKVEDFLSKEIKLFDKIIKENSDNNVYGIRAFDIRTGKGNVSTSDTLNLSKTKTPTHQFKYIDRVLKDGPVTVYCNKPLVMSTRKYLTVFAQRGGMIPKMFLYREADSYSQNVMAIQVTSEKQHHNLVKLFSTTTYKFMLNVLSGGNNRTRKGMPSAFTSGKLKTLPALDLDVSWTNDKVNKELKLSADDIKFIEKYVDQN